jgi:hypothetical protein
MTSRLRAVAIGLALTAALAPTVSAPTPACASVTGPHAALVVDTGSTVDAVCVALDGPSVSGLHLIELAAKQQRVTYAFGFGGQAVCRLDGRGPTGGDCFADYPDFWGYWRGDGHGGWSWSSTGPADSSVGDGDIEGWAWSSGDTGASHTRPPATTTDEICAAPAPAPPPAPRSPTAPAEPAPRSSSRPSATGVTTTPASATRTPTSSTRTRTRSGEVAARVVAADPPAGDGPPAGLLAALGIGLALGAGGWLRLRSSRREGG